MNVYPNLIGGIATRGFKKCVIAKSIGISSKAFSNKLHGITQFTWPEACLLQAKFFPDVDKDILFADDTQSVTHRNSA